MGSTCFGLYDKKEQPCLHCHVSRKCESFRTTHGEELEAILIESALAVMVEEEVAASPMVEILELGPEQAISSLDGVCPECGNALRHRLGKHGEFIGCTAYPICTYTRSVTTRPIPRVKPPSGVLPNLD